MPGAILNTAQPSQPKLEDGDVVFSDAVRIVDELCLKGLGIGWMLRLSLSIRAQLVRQRFGSKNSDHLLPNFLLHR
jgi:hypothetical protein